MFEFKKLKQDDLRMVLDWRTKPEVSKNMLTEVEYDLEKQKKWFTSISQNPRFSYWVVHYNHKPIGLVNTSDFDPVLKTTSLGFYIGEDEFRSLGGFVLIYVYNYLFQSLKIKKIFGEVVEGASIMKMHMAFGYRKVKTLEKHVQKNGIHHDVHQVELLSEDWLKIKKYKKYIANFEA